MTAREIEAFLAVSDENGAALFARNIPGEVVMLNLLRFRDVADYAEFPDLAPDEREALSVLGMP